ncbi:MAG TPA: potassium transporter TrkG [Thermoanaerobaculia bacterium]|nr:potassium transporter TrkG [Thermoanaerobaculia bacterium]HQP85361.1 potassium transporter TrkG [Thermoanaerobaculia bacterium]
MPEGRLLRSLSKLHVRDLGRPVSGRSLRAQFDRAVAVVLRLLALLAIAALLLEHGFDLPAETKAAVRRLLEVVLLTFVGLGLLRLVTRDDRRAFLREHRLDAVVWAVVLLGFASRQAGVAAPVHLFGLDPDDLAGAWLAATQGLIVLSILFGAVRGSRRLVGRRVQPQLVILVSFVLLAAAGTGLLLLPRSTKAAGIDLVDAVFTASSAASITGLAVVDTRTAFTPFGHAILLALFQAGGLGIMTLTTFFAFAFSGGTLRQYASLQSIVGEESLGRIRTTLVEIAVATFAVEAAGAAVLYRHLPDSAVTEAGRLFSSVFHSVSAFCNAGFVLTPTDGSAPGLAGNAPVQATIMVLVVLGGLGFPVLAMLGGILARRRRRPGLQTKLVLTVSALLLTFGTGALLLLEKGSPALGQSAADRFLAALFHSVSARSGGFNTVDLSTLAPASLFAIVVLMWIGGSPASTAGGVKTTTVAVAFLTVFSIAAGKDRVELFRRRIGDASIQRAFATVVVSVILLSVALLGLLALERKPPLDLAFEAVSALSTVGLSTGITPALGAPAKLLLSVLMIAGRVGLLGCVLAATPLRRDARHEYAREDVLIT